MSNQNNCKHSNAEIVFFGRRSEAYKLEKNNVIALTSDNILTGEVGVTCNQCNLNQAWKKTNYPDWLKVILFNIREWREANLSDKSRKILGELPDAKIN